jgi:hypothetical protein
MDFRQDMSMNKRRRLCVFFVTQNSFVLVPVPRLEPTDQVALLVLVEGNHDG